MARPLRIQFKNAWYYVTARGDNGQEIFHDDRDRRQLLDLIGEMIQRHAVEVHAYVLMENHYHLLIRTPNANLSAAVQWLNVAYSIWWGRRHDQGGHVFRGRFKSVLVEPGPRLLECSLHLHLNPVAVISGARSKKQKRDEVQGLSNAAASLPAKRLAVLRGYAWSSFRAYAGYGSAAEWLRKDEVLSHAGRGAGYKRLAEQKLGQGLEEGFWSEVKWGLVLGGAGFSRKIRARIEAGRKSGELHAPRGRRTWAEVVRALEYSRGERWADFANRHGDQGLAMALYVARRCTGLTLRALGEAAGGMDYTTVGMAIKRFEQRIAKEKVLRSLAEDLLAEM